MTDVLHFQTLDDGDIDINGGIVQLTNGLGTAVYLSLFGGNEADNGIPDNPFAWWGNEGEDVENRMVSRLQNLMDSIPANSANLKRLNDAAKADLAWLPRRYDIQVSSSVPGLNKVLLVISINDQTFIFNEEWTRQ